MEQLEAQMAEEMKEQQAKEIAEQKAKENEQKFMMGAENAMEAANKGVVIAPAEAPKSPEKIDPQQFKKRIRKASKKARRKK